MTALWGQANSDGDELGDACDCAPLDSSDPPGPVGHTLVASKGTPTEVVLEWSDEGVPGTFGVHRGHRDGGQAFAHNHACYGASTTSTTTVDGEVPAPGRTHYYLISRIGCAESGLGSGTADARPNLVPCM